MEKCVEYLQERFYLPASDDSLNPQEYLYSYVQREFPDPPDGDAVVYSVPNVFQKTGEKQGKLAEETVFQRLLGLKKNKSNKLKDVWVTFFHNASYAGHSFRNERCGKLMIREHDFVVFAKYKGNFFVALLEVKSTNDINTKKDDLEKTSDSKVIKNNKRSAQHQLRDHKEVLLQIMEIDSKNTENLIQCFIMWPFLGAYTKSPNQQVIKRWSEDGDLHAFEDTLSEQEAFDDWFLNVVLGENKGTEEKYFVKLLDRYIILSCGVFVNEINKHMLALLTQEQLQLLNDDTCRKDRGGPLVVHGAAGTGKTLLVLRKLRQLYLTGQLDEENRALYICYWPGIRCEVESKLEKLGMSKYVDTARYYITIFDFLANNKNKYKHIFMDEAEALCLAFDAEIIHNTYNGIYKRYHDGNCTEKFCKNSNLDTTRDITESINNHNTKNWGELWFMVDINQASLFLPKHSPKILKTPTISLHRIMRSTNYIFNFFKQFYTNPLPKLPEVLRAKIPNIQIGHHINGPPIFWVKSDDSVDVTIANVIIDLCSTKGIKPNDICVLPFLINEKMVPNSINQHIEKHFVEHGYRPKAVGDVECFIKKADLSDFLISWALRVKGLEFKVVIMAIENDDFDAHDSEDRKKAYIMASRCTCMLILISNEMVRNDLKLTDSTIYPFQLSLQMQ